MTINIKRFWTGEELELKLCASLLGVKPGCGMINSFNKIDGEGLFADCKTVGDFYSAWLSFESNRNNKPKNQPIRDYEVA